MVKLDYAISLWNYSHYCKVASLEELLASLRRNNYGVELWHSWHRELDLYNQVVRTRLKSMLRGMPVSLHSEIGSTGKDFHEQQIDIAADLGAEILVVHSDNLFIDDTKTLDIDLTNHITEYAHTRGVKIALENGQLPFLVNAIDNVEGLHICLDTGHVYLTNNSMNEFLSALKNKIVHLHIQEILSPFETGLLDEEGIIIDHYTPGTGGIPMKDWRLLIDTLEEINYEGLAVFEIQPRNPLQTALLGKKFIEELL